MLSKKDAIIAVGMEDQTHTFDQWIQRGIARPAIQSRRRGFASQWDGPSILALALTKRLGEAGLELKVAADIAHKAIRGIGSKRQLQWCVMVDLESKSHAIALAGDGEAMANFQKDRVLAIYIWMPALEDEVARRLKTSKIQLFGGVRNDELRPEVRENAY